MKISEIRKYIEYADPELDVVVISKNKYEELLDKVRLLNRLLYVIKNFK